MANKPFEIQSPTLSINGLAIDTSANAKLVIPGVTRAGTSVAIEVNDTGDQTVNFGPDGDPTTVTVIDGYQFAVLNGDVQAQVGWTAATYAVDALDGEGFIDGISVVTGGAGYTGEAVTYSQQMLATVYQDPINNFNPGDWDYIPFKVRCGAGNIESEFGGGGSGSGLVQRTVNFPTGADGDTAGTMALDPSGNVYVCTADYVAIETQTFDAETVQDYLSSQSNHQTLSVDLVQSEHTDITAILNANANPAEWTLAIDIDPPFNTAQQVISITSGTASSGDFVGQTIWTISIADTGNVQTGYNAGTAFTLVYTPVSQPAIWEQLATGSSGTGDFVFSGTTVKTNADYPIIANADGAVAADGGVEIQFNSDTVNHRMWLNGQDGLAVQINSQLDNGPGGDNSSRWYFTPDGALTFPDGTKQTTAATGGGGSASQPLYIMANADGTVITSTDGVTWTQPVASGVPVGSWGGPPGPQEGIGKLDVHNGVIVYTRADMGVDNIVPATGLYYSTVLGTATLCYGTDSLMGDGLYWNEVHYFADTDKWVAVGWAQGSFMYPVHAYSIDGISWTVLPVNNDILNSWNPSNNNWKLTDVAYSASEGQYVFVGTMEFGNAGAFVTSDVTVALADATFVPVGLNARYISNNPVDNFGGPAGYMMIIPDGYNGFWNVISSFTDPNNWADDSNGPTDGWYQTGATTAFGYIPNIAEVVSVGGFFFATTDDGQVVHTVPAPFLPYAVPLAYTTTDFGITNANPAVLSYTLQGGSLVHNEKIVITGSGEYNGTFYWNSNDNVLYNDQALTSALDASGFAAFASGGTLTSSHGQFIDAVGLAGTTLYAGNDDEQVFRSTDYGSTWTLVDDAADYGAWFNDFGYGLFGGSTNADLVGDGAAGGLGYQYTIYTDIDGYQGGESDGLLVADVAPYAVGDTLTFRNGEVRTITSVSDYDTGVKWIQWNGSVSGGGNDNPRLPFTGISSNYAPATKNTARIKPDNTLAGIGQYMDIYTGAAPVMDDAGHIHMKGHSGNVELFLGTDDNYVSSKEAGSTPAGVKLKSQTDVRVVDSELRMYRNGTWVSIYGDGFNRNIQNHTADVAHANVATDALGNIYVGGEHTYNEDAYVSKYDRDGNLIWNKHNNSDNISARGIYGIATHGDELGIVVRTSQDQNYSYCKLMVLDSATGHVKTITNVYNDNNNVYASDLIYHSTLGWVIAGYNYGDMLTTAPLTAGGATGQNIIEFTTATDTVLTGLYPSYSGAWFVSGTSIQGKQILNNDGVGLWQGATLTTVTGAGQNATINVRVDYNYQTYNIVYPWAAGGTGYADRDIVRIPGSQLNGVNNIPLSGLSGILPESGSDSANLYFLKSNFATMNVDVHVDDIVRDGVNQYFRVTGVVDAGDLWQVSIYALDSNIGSTVGLLTFTRGNDMVICVGTDGAGAVNGTFSYFGKAARTKIRLDMGWMGYNTDFTGGTFTFGFLTDQRPWVWTSSWDRFLEPPVPTDPQSYHGNGFLKTVCEDAFDGGIVVGGYMDNQTDSGSLIWKLNASGSTVWAKSIAADNNDVSGLAVSPTTGAIYGATRWTAIFKLTSTGDLITRKELDNGYLNDACVYVERDDNGVEHVWAGGKGSTYFNYASDGLLVSRFDSNLNVQWSRMLGNYDRNISTNYGPHLRNTVIGNGQATLVGYRSLPRGSNDNGLIYTLSLGDDFEKYDNDGWLAWQAGVRYVEYNRSMYDLITAGVTAHESDTGQDFNGNDIAWTKWTFQVRRQDLNTTKHGITGVGTIEFSDGGTLDHNPVDIPQSLASFYNTSWSYTLKLSDRGRFIMNQQEPNNSSIDNLYIYVPLHEDVPFPVGTVITLINSNDTSAGGYEIFVYPENYNYPNCAKIWCAGMGQNPSQWSFPGMQTATLMKISTNGWLLTANNVTNRD